MLITCINSLLVFIVSLTTCYIWIAFINNRYFLLLVPMILALFTLLYIVENYITEKYKLNKIIYNVVTVQIPAIISILLALIFWLLKMDPLIIRLFLSMCKYMLIPIMIIRLFIELIIRQKVSLIVSLGLFLGMVFGILVIN